MTRKVHIDEHDHEVVIRIDTHGTGRAIADALTQHARTFMRREATADAEDVDG